VSSFYLFDGPGSADSLTNSNGIVTDHYTYTAFGVIQATSGTTINPFTYIGSQGYYRSPDLGKYELRARYYDPASGAFLSAGPPLLNETSILYEPYFLYVQNNPMNRIDPSGWQAAGGPGKAGECTKEEMACIQKAKNLAIQVLKRNRGKCFSVILRLCGNKCSTEALTDCAIDALNTVSFSCSDPDRAHRDSIGRTESLCAYYKGLSARGWVLMWGQPRTCPVPCFSFVPNAANCSLCPGKAPIAMILYRNGVGRRGIDKYCPKSVRALANLLVHEATHNCVGGHDTTNAGQIPTGAITDAAPACDVCGRPDTYAIESAFTKCV
jgi:RHS repeat-associated protein